MKLGTTKTDMINDAPPLGLMAALVVMFGRLVDALSNVVLSSAAIAIGTTASKVKTTATCVFKIDGVFHSLAASDDFWTLSGTNIADGYTNKYLLLVDSADAASVQEGTQALTADDVDFTDAQLANVVGKAIIGVLTVETAGAAFVPGTTLLSAGTVTDTYQDGCALVAQKLVPHV